MRQEARPSRGPGSSTSLAAHLVRTLHKNALTQFLEWHLPNEDGWRVASIMNICHLELPDLGVSRVLTRAVVAAREGWR